MVYSLGTIASADTSYDILDPISYENLQVFFIEGPDILPGKEFVTLKEAMASGTVIVHETGNVGELLLDNTGDKALYIQSGELVKGGRQDRTIQFDFVCAAGAKAMPLPSRCVEAARWHKRHNESAATFSSSEKYLASKKLRAAAYSGDQGEVWSSVQESQMKLSASLRESTTHTSSPSSLQLTLEHGELTRRSGEFQKALAGTVEGRSKVIGFAYAVNGVVEAADLYGSPRLFQKLWPKLLESCIAEAIAEQSPAQAKAQAAKADRAAVERVLLAADRPDKRPLSESERSQITVAEAPESVQYDVTDGPDQPVLHRTVLTRDSKPSPRDRSRPPVCH